MIINEFINAFDQLTDSDVVNYMNKVPRALEEVIKLAVVKPPQNKPHLLTRITQSNNGQISIIDQLSDQVIADAITGGTLTLLDILRLAHPLSNRPELLTRITHSNSGQIPIIDQLTDATIINHITDKPPILYIIIALADVRFNKPHLLTRITQ